MQLDPAVMPHQSVRDELYDPSTGRIDMHELRPVGCLTGNLYSHIYQIFEMKRPNDRYAG